MLYIKLEDGVAVQYQEGIPVEPFSYTYEFGVLVNRDGWMNRNDFKSFAHAEMLADDLNALGCVQFMPVSWNEGWDIIKTPQIGDDVSRGFNGDVYPCGKITKITPSFQITTSTGHKFRRVKDTGKWVEIGGSFYMIPGVVSKLNPHF